MRVACGLKTQYRCPRLCAADLISGTRAALALCCIRHVGAAQAPAEAHHREKGTV